MNVKEAMLKVGFVFLMMLMVFVLYNDIARRMPPGFLFHAPFDDSVEFFSRTR
jgi:hypothetical protein